MQNISLKIIQTEKKMTVITCAYMYMNNTIVKHHYSVCTQDCYIQYTCTALPFRLYRWGSGWRPPTGRWRGDVPSCPPTAAAVACALTQSRPRSDLRGQKCIVDDVIHGNYISPKHGLRLCVVLWCHSYSRSSIFIDLYPSSEDM